MLVDGGINSEHNGLNNIMFNYSYDGILANEYEVLTTKNAAIMGPVLTVENTMNLIGHTVAFSEVLQSTMG